MEQHSSQSPVLAKYSLAGCLIAGAQFPCGDVIFHEASIELIVGDDEGGRISPLTMLCDKLTQFKIIRRNDTIIIEYPWELVDSWASKNGFMLDASQKTSIIITVGLEHADMQHFTTVVSPMLLAAHHERPISHVSAPSAASIGGGVGDNTNEAMHGGSGLAAPVDALRASSQASHSDSLHSSRHCDDNGYSEPHSESSVLPSTDEAPAPPLHRLGLNVHTIIAQYLDPKNHKDLELTSRTLMQAVWNGPRCLTARSLASLIAVATLIAPYALDPPAEIVFRAGSFPTAAATSVAATTNTTSQPLLQNVWGRPLSLVFDSCTPDLTALRSLLDFSTVTSLTVRGKMSLTVLTELLKALPNLRTLNLSGNSLGDVGATAVADVLKHTPKLQTLNLSNNDINAVGATAVADGLKHTPNLLTLNLDNS